MADRALVLASASPRRRELLDQIGVEHRVAPVDLDESRGAGEAPPEYVVRLAREKAEAGWQRLADREREVVLAADTAVVLGDDILGKPRDRADGLAMLLQLSGRTHQVLTAVALRDAGGMASQLSESLVTFRPISRDEAEQYWATGEPRDKAGAYAIQGRAAVFIERIEGSYSGVMGLPLFETARLLGAAGLGPARKP
ncbi:MAG TPA: Maf family protein [Steroidobacteraceae bacterium]|nr:Maf family protein [Steroidobacteraceae bacterium]